MTVAAAGKRLFQWSGALAAVRFRNRGYLRILMYHRFGEGGRLRPQFERQCRHLRRHYRVLELREVARRLADGSRFPPHAVVITVDDGHADFYREAYPVLRRWGLPATLYLTTGYLDGRCWLWFDLVDYLFEQTGAARLELEFLGAMELRSAGAKRAAAEAVKEAALRMPNTAREELMAGLPRALKVDVPPRPPARWEPLSWDQVREMASGGIEFGAHTLTHPILSRVADEGRLEREIREPKQRIEQELGRETLHFCYPNGQPGDYTPAIVERVRQAGFQTAVTAEQGLNPAGASRYLLKRVPVEPDRDWGVFTRAVAGFRLR